jgi:hypothetical protein
MYLFFRPERFAVLLYLHASGSDYVKNKKDLYRHSSGGLIPVSATSSMPRKGSVADLSPPPVVVNKQNKRTGHFFLGQLCPTLKELGKNDNEFMNVR